MITAPMQRRCSAGQARSIQRLSRIQRLSESEPIGGVRELPNMAGAPKRRAVLAELRRRAVLELGEGATALDYAEAWTAEGRTLTALASVLSGAPGIGETTREIVRLAVYSEENRPGEAAERLRIARARGAHALLEANADIADTATESRDALAKAKLRTDIRDRIARVWNREEMGEQRQTALTVNIGTLHLDSLRRSTIGEATSNPLALQGAESQAVDAEVVNTSDSDDDASGSTS